MKQDNFKNGDWVTFGYKWTKGQVHDVTPTSYKITWFFKDGNQDTYGPYCFKRDFGRFTKLNRTIIRERLGVK